MKAAIRNCARCGGDHGAIDTLKLTNPVAPSDISPKLCWDRWASCPTTGEPILFETSTFIAADSGEREHR